MNAFRNPGRRGGPLGLPPKQTDPSENLENETQAENNLAGHTTSTNHVFFMILPHCVESKLQKRKISKGHIAMKENIVTPTKQ